MIDKIDRPDAPQPYRINEPKSAKEDQHQGSGRQEEKEERYQQKEENREWEKFHRQEFTIKPMRIRRIDIDRCLFRSASTRSGAAYMIADLVWKNGQRTEGALLLAGKIEDYFHLKKMKSGDMVPEEYWVRGDEIEVGIPHMVSGSGPISIPNLENTHKEKRKRIRARYPEWLLSSGFLRRDGRINWGVVLGLLFALFILLLAIIQTL